MSEYTKRFQVPPEQSFDTVGLQGSMQEVLRDNIGAYVSVDFLIGNQTIITQEGQLYYVGTGYIVLFQENGDYVVCDVFSIKFVTFIISRIMPRNTDETAPTSSVMTPAQAAYTHAVRRRK